MVYKEAPADALVLAATFRIMEYRSAPFAFGARQNLPSGARLK
jgi:hypothetical protein